MAVAVVIQPLRLNFARSLSGDIDPIRGLNPLNL